MDLTGDLDALLTDFGTTVTVGSTSFLAIFNEPDQVIGELSISTDYSILAKTSDVSSLVYNDAVTVGSDTYTVRKNMKQDDGAMSLVTLSKDDSP